MTDFMELVGLVEQRIGRDFDGECHLTSDEARRIAACIREMVEWRPIETAPRDGRRFIGFGPECGVDFMHYQTGDGGRPEGFRDSFIRVFAAGVDDHPTHWLPLPPAPGAEA